MSVQGIVDVEVTLNADKDVEVSEDKKNHLAIITPKRFLGNETFKDLNTKIWKMGGKYVSAGKNSHWEIPLKPKEEKPIEKPIVKKCSRCGTQTSAPTIYEGKILCSKCAGDIKTSLEQPIPINLQPFQMLSIDKILSIPQQIREEKTDLTELVESIKEVGILEPILVRPKESGKYEVVFGSRRLAAVKQIGLKEIPCIVKLLSDDEAYEIQLIENIQREDVKDIEVAHWLDRLLKKFPDKYPTQESLAKKIGKSRDWVTKHLNMIRLEESNIVTRVTMDKLDEGHAREILSAPVEKRSEIIEKITEHIEETGKPLPISQIHEIAHPQEPTSPEVSNIPQTSKEVTAPESEPLDVADFTCSICNQEFRLVHVNNKLHRFQPVRKEKA